MSAGLLEVETPRNKFQRVLGALEDLVAQEELLLLAGDFSALAELQDRAEPLVEFLAAASSVADESLRGRVSAVIGRRTVSGKKLSQQIDQVRGDLREIQTSRQRLVQVVPAYRQPAEEAVNGQLSARG